MTFKSINVWVISFFFFSSWRVKTRSERILIYLSCGVICIRDKVGNLGQFDDKTLFKNELKLQTNTS